MKLWKTLTALTLSAVMALGGLTACSGDQPGAAGADAADDVVLQTAGIPRDQVLLTIDGQEITAEEYLYWLAYSTDYLVNYYYGTADALDWSDGTIAEYVQSNALDAVSLYRQAQSYAQEEGITLNEEEQAAMEADIQSTLEAMGDEAAYTQRLSQSCLTPESFQAVVERFYLYSALMDRMYGQEGSQPVSTADIEEYIDGNGIYRAKHILLLTVDMTTGESLDADTVAQKRTTAEDLLAQLRASDAPLTLFDELMNQYSEDTGLSTNPDGYTTQTGAMVTEFETAALALEPGEISDIVESTYGYHIILRLAVDTEQYRDTVASSLLDAALYQRVDAQTVEYTDEFEQLDPEAFYTNLTTYRSSQNSTAGK